MLHFPLGIFAPAWPIESLSKSLIIVLLQTECSIRFFLCSRRIVSIKMKMMLKMKSVWFPAIIPHCHKIQICSSTCTCWEMRTPKKYRFSCYRSLIWKNSAVDSKNFLSGKVDVSIEDVGRGVALYHTVHSCWTLDLAGHGHDISTGSCVTQTTKPLVIVVTMSVSMLTTCHCN